MNIQLSRKFRKYVRGPYKTKSNDTVQSNESTGGSGYKRGPYKKKNLSDNVSVGFSSLSAEPSSLTAEPSSLTAELQASHQNIPAYRQNLTTVEEIPTETCYTCCVKSKESELYSVVNADNLISIKVVKERAEDMTKWKNVNVF